MRVSFVEAVPILEFVANLAEKILARLCILRTFYPLENYLPLHEIRVGNSGAVMGALG
jgi:hypothetical protein